MSMLATDLPTRRTITEATAIVHCSSSIVCLVAADGVDLLGFLCKEGNEALFAGGER